MKTASTRVDARIVAATNRDLEPRGRGGSLQAITAGRRAALARFDRTIVEQALRGAKGNRTSAAAALGISRVTLHRWIRRHGLA